MANTRGSARATAPMKFSALGVTVDNPPTWFVVVLVFAGIAFAVWKFVLRDPELITQQQAIAALTADMAEYRKHLGEDPVARKPITGTMSVAAYADDCLVILTTIDGEQRTKLVPSLALDRPRRTARGRGSILLAEWQGRCVDGHPDVPAEQQRRLDQCRIEVTRTYADGCWHTQEFDACRGWWGPVVWRNCVH